MSLETKRAGRIWGAVDVERICRTILPRVDITFEGYYHGVRLRICKYPKVDVLITAKGETDQIDAPDREYLILVSYGQRDGEEQSTVCSHINLAHTLDSITRGLLADSVTIAKAVIDAKASERNRLHPD